jgi:uncharacterized membrane protein (DUF2068 family)
VSLWQTNHTALGLRAIGAYKLAKATAFSAAGVYVTRLGPGDAAGSLLRLAARLRLDPDNHLVHSAVARVSGLDERHLDAIGAGVVLYGLLYFVQGIGLIWQKRWAEWLVVGTTGFLVPFEAYEVVTESGVLRLAVLVLNLGIVAYLLDRLRKDRKGELS